MPLNLLDEPIKFRALDPLDMMGLVLSLPRHCWEAREKVTKGFQKPKFQGIQNVVISGMGGSAIGGDVVRALVGKTARSSLTVNRNYGLPAWVSKGTLVICSSYSGGTEETLSVFQEALKRRLPLVVLTSGGKLLKTARERRVPYVEIVGGLPPRAAFGHCFTTLLTVLERLGLLPSHEKDFQAALKDLEKLALIWGPLSDTVRNEAKRLALFLHGKLPVFYAGQDHFDAVGLRWKCQMNENAKQVALFNVVPEMNHNEILGFTQADGLTRKMAVVLLRNPQGDHSQIGRRFDILKQVLKGKVSGVKEIAPEEKTLLGQMLSAIYLGDFVSVYLAYLKRVDPTDIETIDYFKKRLSKV